MMWTINLPGLSTLVGTCILLLVSSTTHAHSPTAPYYFHAPAFYHLLPFSQDELQQFKAKQVTKLEVSQSGYRTVYHLNTLGQVTSYEDLVSRRKKEAVVDSGHYTYNAQGLLTVARITNEHRLFYDSIAYDLRGRIIAYYSYEQALYGKAENRNRIVYYNLFLISSDENKVIMGDTAFGEITRYTLNNTNNVQVIHYSDRTDSVSVASNGESGYVERCWYKMETDTAFRVGAESIYKHGLIQEYTRWEMLYNGSVVVEKTYYRYDQLNRLVLRENENIYKPRTFYSYYENGLCMEEITVGRAEVFRKQFRYWFT